MRIDRFGNLITNIDRRSFEQFAEGGAIAVVVGGREVPRIVATYADAPAGELCALFGSTDHLEVAINARRCGPDPGPWQGSGGDGASRAIIVCSLNQQSHIRDLKWNPTSR